MGFSGVAKLGKAMFAAVSNMVNPECLNSKKALQSDILFRFWTHQILYCPSLCSSVGLPPSSASLSSAVPPIALFPRGQLSL